MPAVVPNLIRGITAFGFTVLAALGITTVQILTLGLARRRIASRFMNWYGRTGLRIIGVTVHVEGRERLTMNTPCILTFNHASTMEIALIPSLLPPKCTVLAKQEFLFYPLIGQAIWALGLVPVKRKTKEHAHRAIEIAAEKLSENALSVVIAPEGTRSPDGTLQRFKLGAFHLALATGAPIVPVVMHGTYNIWPREAWLPSPGHVWVRVLAPVDTADFTRENLRDKAADLEERYHETLAELAREHPAGVPEHPCKPTPTR